MMYCWFVVLFVSVMLCGISSKTMWIYSLEKKKHLKYYFGWLVVVWVRELTIGFCMLLIWYLYSLACVSVCVWRVGVVSESGPLDNARWTHVYFCVCVFNTRRNKIRVANPKRHLVSCGWVGCWLCAVVYVCVWMFAHLKSIVYC